MSAPRESVAPRLGDREWDALAGTLRASRMRGDERLRALADAALWALRTGEPWSALPARFPEAASCRRAWRAWMRDGSWVEFWSGYVAGLATRERRAWRQALARRSRALREGFGSREWRARAAWWLVSSRILSEAIPAR